jgi:hypothetical protein
MYARIFNTTASIPGQKTAENSVCMYVCTYVRYVGTTANIAGQETEKNKKTCMYVCVYIIESRIWR